MKHTVFALAALTTLCAAAETRPEFELGLGAYSESGSALVTYQATELTGKLVLGETEGNLSYYFEENFSHTHLAGTHGIPLDNWLTLKVTGYAAYSRSDTRGSANNQGAVGKAEYELTPEVQLTSHLGLDFNQGGNTLFAGSGAEYLIEPQAVLKGGLRFSDLAKIIQSATFWAEAEYAIAPIYSLTLGLTHQPETSCGRGCTRLDTTNAALTGEAKVLENVVLDLRLLMSSYGEFESNTRSRIGVQFRF